MPRRRDLKLDKYGISKEAYRELRSFCLQYEEKKARLQQLRSIASAPITGMPGKNEPGNPTAKHAEIAVKLSNDIAMIEQSALEASGNLYQHIIQHVTREGATYEKLCPPCGRRQFYEYRRIFFYFLWEKMGNTGDVLL